MSDPKTPQGTPGTEQPTGDATATAQAAPQPDFGADAAASGDAANAGTTGDAPAAHADLEMLRDVELRVTAELGRAKLTLGEVTSLSGGSIVTLDKAAGEAVDLRINDQLFASGEVIVMDGYFAVKITKLLSKEERMKRFS